MLTERCEDSASSSSSSASSSSKGKQKKQFKVKQQEGGDMVAAISAMPMNDVFHHRQQPHSPDMLDSDAYSISGLSPPLFVSDNSDSAASSPVRLLGTSQEAEQEALHRLSVDFENLELEREKMRQQLGTDGTDSERERERQREQLSMLALVLATLRRSLLTCKASEEEAVSMDIGWPTNVQHVTHVTFDRFNGFLGLPVEFEIEIPRPVPSASASVFGVSPESMQCSYDSKGNNVPTILLLMQERLYSQGGLKAEGIFRINAENSHEESVREQLNRGCVPHDIDPHCLAGLIKSWFRELPKGVLDSLTPEQVMQCHTEEHCVELVKLLPPTQAALLDWAVNLMADVAQEVLNKMNSRNVAMVFAPNMTQMADPLMALMHAVQVMNFLKTLILRTLRDRQEAVLDPGPGLALPGARSDDSDGCGGVLTLAKQAEEQQLEADEGEEEDEREDDEEEDDEEEDDKENAVATGTGKVKADAEDYGNYRRQSAVVRSSSKAGGGGNKSKARGARLIIRIDKQKERAEAW